MDTGEASQTTRTSSRRLAMRNAFQPIVKFEAPRQLSMALDSMELKGISVAERSAGWQASKIAAGIARRLLKVGRAAEAMAVLQQSAPKKETRTGDDLWLDGYRRDLGDSDWDDACIDVLDAIGEAEQAQ